MLVWLKKIWDAPIIIIYLVAMMLPVMVAVVAANDNITDKFKYLDILLGVGLVILALAIVRIWIPYIITAYRECNSACRQKEIDRLKHEIETLKRNQVAKS